MVLLVFSVTDEESLEALDYWIEELDRNASPDIVRFLVGAKVDDIDETQVSKQVAQEYAQKYNAHLFMTSAKENTGITQLFNAVNNQCGLNFNLANVSDPNDRRSISYRLHKPTITSSKADDDDNSSAGVEELNESFRSEVNQPYNSMVGNREKKKGCGC